MDAILIVIDGPAGVGKGSISDRLANHLHFRHIDSGLMYRAAGLICKETGMDPVRVAVSLMPTDLARLDLRSNEASQAASGIAGLPAVREAINLSLRRIASTPPGTVMDGRAGAHEFPEAQVKVFLTASPEERAKRRHKQLLMTEEGIIPSLEEVLLGILARDKKDMERAVSPLTPHPDALYIDTTDKSENEVFNLVSEPAINYCAHALLRRMNLSAPTASV